LSALAATHAVPCQRKVSDAQSRMYGMGNWPHCDHLGSKQAANAGIGGRYGWSIGVLGPNGAGKPAGTTRPALRASKVSRTRSWRPPTWTWRPVSYRT
jgi:hypothetical protein